MTRPITHNGVSHIKAMQMLVGYQLSSSVVIHLGARVAPIEQLILWIETNVKTHMPVLEAKEIRIAV